MPKRAAPRAPSANAPAPPPREASPPREFYVSAPRAQGWGEGSSVLRTELRADLAARSIVRPPNDTGCPCGGGGVCAPPTRGLTHAEYAQIVRARVEVHRQRAEAEEKRRADAAAPRPFGTAATIGRPAREASPPREEYVSAPRAQGWGPGGIVRPPNDTGCPCGNSGVCAPQRGLTHAEYSQVIRARVEFHRQRADGAVPHRTVFTDTAAEVRRLGPTATVERPARDPFRRIVDSPLATAFDTAEWAPRDPRARVVRRYATWYASDGLIYTDEREVAAVPKLSKNWRAAAKRDAAAVGARLSLCGYRKLRELAETVDRRGKPGCDRVVLADALCVYKQDGVQRRALGAHCVQLMDDGGLTRACMIYLPIDE